MARQLRPKRKKLTLQLLSVLLVVIVLSAGVTWSISPVDPVNWQSPAAMPFDGPLAPNGRLEVADHLAVPAGPEDIAVTEDGTVIAGVADGRLMRISPGEPPEAWARVDGRPLGMAWHPDGRLYVCVTGVGLVAVAPDGTTEVVLSEFRDRPLPVLDDVDIAADGTIYVTEATNRFEFEDWKLDLIENRGAGRLLRIEPDGTVNVLLHDLHFANGVAVATDESYLLVVETARYRVRRLLLDGAPSSGVIIDGLPGFPDGISNAGDDTFWLTVAAPRHPLIDALSRYGAARRILAAAPQEMLPKPGRIGLVMRVNDAGMILESLHDRRSDGFSMITNAEQVGNKLYLGTLDGSAIGVVHLETEPPAESSGESDTVMGTETGTGGN